MLGGGYFTAQNKVLPGAYINIVSANAAGAAITDRGVVATGMELDWGKSGEIIEITTETLATGLLEAVGYDFTADEVKEIREVMKHATKLLIYRLNGDGNKATNAYGSAKYAGTRGNDLKIVITTNVDDPVKFDVATYLGTDLVDKQLSVATAEELVNNAYFEFDAGASLAVTSGTSCSGGTNSTVTGTQHSAFLADLESESFNVLYTASTDSTIKALYVAYTKRMIEEVGVKIQTVLYDQAADHEGVINVATAAALVPWVAGAEAGCAINASLTNRPYDGEETITTKYTQSQLKAAIEAGQIVFHKVGDTYRVLKDINSLVTVTSTKNADFKNNQTIRVINQIGNDVAALFNNGYLGVVQNDAAGRVSFWSALVDYFNQLLQVRAIERFDANADIIVEAGEAKNSVVVNTQITPVSCMEILYMTVYVA